MIIGPCAKRDSICTFQVTFIPVSSRLLTKELEIYCSALRKTSNLFTIFQACGISTVRNTFANESGKNHGANMKLVLSTWPQL